LRGPALHAIIAVNPKSTETAAEMDFNTFDIPTRAATPA
jgi:hypothetical protein